MPVSSPPDFITAATKLQALEGAGEIALPPGRALYVPGWLDPATADQLLSDCLRDLDWSSPSIRMFGRELAIPRRHAFVGDPGIRYRWSGLEQRAEPWPPALRAVRRSLAEIGLGFNSLLANHYRSGNDSMGWHADDESELGAMPVIATVSLGQERKLRFRRKSGGSACGIPLGHGSLLLTSGEVQQYWVHEVAKSRASMIDRVSLTFRYIDM